MGNTKWTAEQYQAITERNRDILVAAAAGSGKTAVLVERIIGLIMDEENPVDVDRLLVLTFTNAAAAQMRQRIRAAVEKLLEENPENLNLQRQLTLLNRAPITTIDAFSLRIVRENYMYVDIDPAFRIGDDKELDVMKQGVLEELFEKKYALDGDDGFFGLVECFGEETGDKALRKLVLEIYDFVQSNPFPEQWYDRALANFRSEQSLNDSLWGRFAVASVHERTGDFINKMELAVQLTNLEGGPVSYQPALLAYLSFLENLAGEWDYGNMKSLFEQLDPPPFGRKKKDDDEVLTERVKELRKTVKDGIDALKEAFFFAGEGELRRRHEMIYPILESLITLVKEFSKAYLELKKDKQVLYFNDIAHFALDILLEKGSTETKPIPSGVAKAVRQRFCEVLTDEYQDSNMVQEMLLYAVSGGEEGRYNRFMVGDIKQSIYSFRQADPSIFLDKFRTYSERGNQIRIDLSKNFRSRANILEGINLVFSQVMSSGLGDVDYDERSALYPGASFPPLPQEKDQEDVELHIINKKDLSEGEDEDGELDTAELEMTLAARRITELIDGGFQVYDETQGYRNIEFRDIVILLRSMPKWAAAAGKALGEAGIPVLAPAQSSYFDNKEVLVILNILKLIDNFRQDIPLLAVLKSPIYGVNDDELLKVKLFYDGEGFYDAVTAYIERHEPDELKERLIRFKEDISRWKKLSAYTPVNRLLWTIYNETGYYDYLSVRRLGSRRQANLMLLIQKAETLENTNSKGLFNFLRYVEKLSQVSRDDTQAVPMEDGQNMVRITTIHKSKGLEFPVVFVCGLGKNFNTMDIKQKMILHQTVGVGMEYIDFESRVRYNTLSKSVMKEARKTEMLSEELRVLYVALTRAKEKLILCGTVRNLDKSVKKWTMNYDREELLLPLYDRKKAGSYLDWIAPALVRHRSGEVILDYTGLYPAMKPEELYKNNAAWHIRLWQRQEVMDWAGEMVGKKAVSKEEDVKTDAGLKKRIMTQLRYIYPYRTLTRLPANISVSEIKRHRAEEQAEGGFLDFYPQKTEFKRPKFKDPTLDTPLTPAQKGTAVHTVMEHLDLGRDYTIAELEEKIEDLCNRRILLPEEAQAVNTVKIKKFFQSPLGIMLQSAERIYKEESFAMELTPFEVYGDEEYKEIEEGMLIHGIIDCFFIKDNQVTLFDYKTDYTPDNSGSELAEKYKVQMEIYRKAIERILGRQVADTYIYSFYLDRAIRV